MILTKSAEVLNFYLNHSSIYPNIAPDGTGYIDASDLLKKDGTHCFLFEGGVVLFFWDGVFKGDVYFLPQKRGFFARDAAEQALNYMFRFAEKIIVEAPDFNKASQRFIGSLGFVRSHVRPLAWSKDNTLYDVVVYEMVKNDKYR